MTILLSYLFVGIVMTAISFKEIASVFNSTFDRLVMSLICVVLAPAWGVVKLADMLIDRFAKNNGGSK